MHPEVPSCAECQEWWYDPEDWHRVEKPKGNPLKRPKRSEPPCRRCPKAGVREPYPHPEKELNEKNQRAWWYFLQCREDPTGLLPRDEIVVQNNALIRRVMEEVAEHKQQFGHLELLTLMLPRKR